MNSFAVFLIQSLTALIAFGLIAKFYIYPRLKRLPLFEALTILCFFQAFRSLGLSYLVPGIVNGPIPRNFALQAGYGDLLTATLGFIAIGLLRNRKPGAIAFVWLVNIVGSLDLLNAYYLGISLGGWNYHPGAVWYLPALLVPILIAAHVMAFMLLFKNQNSQ
jgi:hypothetical protein